MSLSQRIVILDTPKDDSNPRHRVYGFVLALLCTAFALALVGAILSPVRIGSGVSSDISIVGP
jgi:hypothetical protein